MTVLLFTLLPISALAQDDNHDNHEDWTALTEITNNTLPAGKYYLSGNLTCTGGEQTAITINGEVTLCLNGHVLNLNGQSLHVGSGATFHLCDCNSTNQTHKFTVGNDGLWTLDESGDKELTGGGITGGNASYYGGGVFVGSTFEMSGGSISGNTSTFSGGGVYVAGAGYSSSFTISGAPNITGNTKTGGSADNVYLDWMITIGEDGLTEGANIGVTLGSVSSVANNWDSSKWGNPAEYFTADNSDYGVGLDDQGNVVLKEGTYSVILYPNDGMIAEGQNVTSYTSGTSVTLPTANDVTREGYTFAGWYDNKDLSGSVVTEITANDKGDKKYWAKWTINSYTVRFDKNADDAEGTMEDQSFTYDVPQALSANTFTRTGYTFTGWNTAPDGTGTSYSDKQEVSNLSSAVGGEVTLYAQWTINSYTITVQVANGCEDMGEVTGGGTYEYDATATLTATANSGYQFVKWEDGETSATREITVTGDATYTALFEAEPYEPELEPEPEPTYFTLDFDDHPCEGVTLNSNLTAVEEGGTLYLYVEKEDETLYDYDNMRIYAKRGANAEWEELTEDPKRPGVYPIKNIRSDIFIKVEGVTPKDPTAIERVETLRIYASAGLLHVETPTRQRVTIVSMAGALIADGEQEGHHLYRDLPAGIYIVRVGDYATKVWVE